SSWPYETRRKASCHARV
ncbi:DEAD/DEAH box helicase family protein, partial [Vibrio parahaemolyticus V-223/04]